MLNHATTTLCWSRALSSFSATGQQNIWRLFSLVIWAAGVNVACSRVWPRSPKDVLKCRSVSTGLSSKTFAHTSNKAENRTWIHDYCHDSALHLGTWDYQYSSFQQHLGNYAKCGGLKVSEHLAAPRQVKVESPSKVCEQNMYIYICIYTYVCHCVDMCVQFSHNPTPNPRPQPPTRHNHTV